LRLCVDLRPLNNRIHKQKFPFPLIEDCLTQLSNKSVFSLLYLKDSFHQIKVEDGSTKYFAFAMPDGQFEYNYLPFDYAEAPAEFQKRLLQVLQPLVRGDKIIVYMLRRVSSFQNRRRKSVDSKGHPRHAEEMRFLLEF